MNNIDQNVYAMIFIRFCYDFIEISSSLDQSILSIYFMQCILFSLHFYCLFFFNFNKQLKIQGNIRIKNKLALQFQ